MKTEEAAGSVVDAAGAKGLLGFGAPAASEVGLFIEKGLLTTVGEGAVAALNAFGVAAAGAAGTGGWDGEGPLNGLAADEEGEGALNGLATGAEGGAVLVTVG